MPAGSLVGALAATQLADRIGRKKTIIIAGLIWVIGSILQCASVVRSFIFLPSSVYESYKHYYLIIFKNRGMLVAGRIIAGISVGLSSAVVPIYQSEITAPAIRGRMVSLQQWYTRQYYL